MTFGAIFAALFALVGLLAASRAGAVTLPDGRGYELASPVEKGSNDVSADPTIGLPLASRDGGAVAYLVVSSFPGAVSNGAVSEYRAVRGTEAWASVQLNSAQGPIPNIAGSSYNAFTEDLSAGLQTGPFTPPLTPGAGDETNNVYLHDPSGFHLITPGAPKGPFFSAIFRGASENFDRIFYKTPFYNLEGVSPDTPPGVETLYEWQSATGAVKSVDYLPSGPIDPEGIDIAEPPGPIIATPRAFRPVSTDASIVYVSPALRNEPGLWARIDGTTAVEISRSRRGVPDPLGPFPAKFRIASADGRTAFFTSREKLTEDATTGPQDEGEDLYRYRLDGEELTDITVDPTDAAGAQVRAVLGSAADGSSLYFIARGVLAEGATAGDENLYRWVADGTEKGTITYVASEVGPANYEGFAGPEIWDHRLPARVTPDGRTVLFVSNQNLTAYDSNGKYEAYLYDSSVGRVLCATCNPSGAKATADAIPVGAGDEQGRARIISDDGRFVFFSSAEALVPEDVNDQVDAYEFDVATGRTSLISSGNSAYPSPYADSSADGGSVFFVTRSQLVGIDRDENYDVYSARIGGGLAGQQAPVAPAECLGLACRTAAPASPGEISPASASVHGRGDLTGVRCRAVAAKAKRVARRAASLRRRAGHVGGRRASTLKRAAAHQASAAKHLRTRAKRCAAPTTGIGR